MMFFLLTFMAFTVVTFADNHQESVIPDVGVARESRILIQDEYQTLVSRLDSQQHELDQLKAAMTTRPGKVAFKAQLTKPVSPGVNSLIVFDDVRFNLGDAYHHGTFIAPYSGTYLFSVKVCSTGGHFIFVDLMKNGVLIGQVLAGDDAFSDCSSETTVTELNAGDDVIVQHHGGSGDYIHGDDNHHNSFTGVFLY